MRLSHIREPTTQTAPQEKTQVTEAESEEPVVGVNTQSKICTGPGVAAQLWRSLSITIIKAQFYFTWFDEKAENKIME